MAKIDWTRATVGVRKPVTRMNPSREAVIRSLMPTGPFVLGLGLKPIVQGGPGEPPAGFVGGTTSKSEWYMYWAYEILLGKEGEFWGYQQSFLGGRHNPGGAVADFVLYMPKQNIIVRLQTWRFHFALGAEKIATDMEQKINLFSPFGEEIVVDVYEQDFIWDETGKAVLEVCKDSIEGREWNNPLATGTTGDFG